MSKRISSSYQQKKLALKNVLDVREKDREIYRFHQTNPDFPASLISDRLNIGQLAISFLKVPSLFPLEGQSFSVELPSFGMMS